ncbi:MAG: flagellar export protein FliJ [Fibrobacteres bacterium]|nr:flagellar export protein FliJ [Fibrobacterota bacterium]
MKKFKFNLEAVRRLYTIHEEEKKKKLAEANRLLMQAEQELQRLGKEYDDSQDAELKRREEGESVYSMRLYIQYAFDLKIRIESQKQRVLDAARTVSAARNELIEAKRKVKSIERLKEKQLLAWKKERNRYEAKVVDDLCQQQFIRLKEEAAA